MRTAPRGPAYRVEAGLLHDVGLALPERDFHVLRHLERYRSRAASALLGLMGL